MKMNSSNNLAWCKQVASDFAVHAATARQKSGIRAEIASAKTPARSIESLRVEIDRLKAPPPSPRQWEKINKGSHTSPPSARWRTAVHEIGHAAIAAMNAVKIWNITIEEDDGGAVLHAIADRRSERLILIAGAAAELVFFADSDSPRLAGDRAALAALGVDVPQYEQFQFTDACAEPATARKKGYWVYADLLAETEATLRDVRPFLEQQAENLYRDGKIDGGQFEKDWARYQLCGKRNRYPF